MAVDVRTKNSKTGEDGSYQTAQDWIGFDLDLSWIVIGGLKIQAMSPLAL